MKNLLHIKLLLVFFSAFFSIVYIQAQNVGVNADGNTPEASAGLDVDFSDRGMLIPRLTTAQRDAINSGSFANSLLIFNTDLQCFQTYIGSQWQNVFCNLICSAPPSTPGSISGTSTPCQNATGQTYSTSQVAGATSYIWNVPSGATIIAGQGTLGIIVDFGTTDGQVSVVATNSCGLSSAQTLPISLQVAPSQPSVITGNSTVCAGDNGVSYSVTNVSGVTYTWGYSSGSGFSCATNCSTNSITSNFSGAATNGTLNVTPSNSCGTGTARTLGITVNSPPTTTAAGSDQNLVCTTTATLAGNTPTVGTGTWTRTSGSGIVTTPSSPTSGITGLTNGTNTFRWTISNSPCSDSFDEVNIIVSAGGPPAQPGSISGPATTSCPGDVAVFSIAAVSGATSYTWTVPSHVTINSGQGTTSINTTLGLNGCWNNLNISVTASNGCGTSSAQSVTLNNTMEAIVFQNFNVNSVSNGGTQPTFVVGAPRFISRIHTYHFNGGGGVAPGTISLFNVGTSTTYGPYPAIAAVSCIIPHPYYWEAYPGVTIPAGTYRVVDSSPGTWSSNATSGGVGFARVIACP